MLDKNKTMLSIIFDWLNRKFHSIMISISLALMNTENDILKANYADLDETKKLEYTKLHRIAFLNKMNQGQKDEFYKQHFYEILRLSDKFMRTATPERIAQVGDRYSMNYGQKDEYGRRHEHYGFYDDQHKHAGKTIAEATIDEIEERRLKDDNYKIIYIISNKPIEDGLSKLDEFKELEDGTIIALTPKEKFLQKKQNLPLKVIRSDDTISNKIEYLTDVLHVKKIGMDYRMLEFFISKTFKLGEQDINGNVFKQLLNIDMVWTTLKYGELLGFKIDKYEKLIIGDVNDYYDIIKFTATEIENKDVLN